MINFYYPLVPFLIFPLGSIILYYLKPKGARNILRVASKLVIIFIILLSIASPYTEIERTGITGSTDVTIIADRTDSMRLFNPGTTDEVYNYLSNRTATTIDFISGTRSPIGDHIIKNVKSDGNILLISDGSNNYGKSLPDAINFARSLNATIYLLNQQPIKKDMSVSISGDAMTILDTPFVFYIDIDSVGEIEGDLKVWVDDRVVSSEHITQSKRFPITYSFRSTGSHTIKAEITGNNDEIHQNNVFYRSVHVIPKPGILLVSKEDSPLSRILGQSYSLNISSNPADAVRHKAVFLDDMDAAELSDHDAAFLGDYVVDGGGLVVVGGPHAYTDYSSRPLFELLLPVKHGGVPPVSKNAAIVLIVDISGSTGELSGTDPALGIEKGLALQVLDGLGADDFIGVVAFNNAPHVIVPFARYPDKSGIENSIAQLRYGGTTHLSPALASAHDMLKNFGGGRNVIVISDGQVADSDAALKVAGSLADDGVTVYSIGVGGNTNEEFMKRLSKTGGGGYLKRDQTHGIKPLFSEIINKGRGDGYPLLIINGGHFITRDVTLNATVYGYNNVFTKQNAQTLVMTGNGNPVISTWRFGLGRVVSITVDNGNMWAPALYSKDNSRIISTLANYAIGNPQQDTEIRAPDGETNEPIEVQVLSDREPSLSFDGVRLQFKREGERTFRATITANSTGFHDLSGYIIAVNEPSEFRALGNNELISRLITASGGQVYNQSEIGRLVPDITNKNTGAVHTVVDLGPVFLLAALLLYSAEVILRRLAEIIR